MTNGKNILVAYFSASGETERLARTIAQTTDGDLHEIEPAVPYTAADLDWNDKRSRSSVEMNDPSSRPAIASRVGNMDAYDFSGKTVVPFATSGGSGLGGTESILHERCSPETTWKPGKRLSSRASEAEVARWVESLGL